MPASIELLIRTGVETRTLCHWSSGYLLSINRCLELQSQRKIDWQPATNGSRQFRERFDDDHWRLLKRFELSRRKARCLHAGLES